MAEDVQSRPPGMQRFKRPPGLKTHHLPPFVQHQTQLRDDRRPTDYPAQPSRRDRDEEGSDGDDDERFDDDADQSFVTELQRNTGYDEDQVRELLAAYRASQSTNAATKKKTVATSLEATSGIRVPMPLPPPSAASGVEGRGTRTVVGPDGEEKSDRRKLQDQLDDLMHDIHNAQVSREQELQEAQFVITRARNETAARAAARERELRARADAPIPASLKVRDEHVVRYEVQMQQRAERQRQQEEAKEAARIAAEKERKEKGFLSNIAIKKRMEDSATLAGGSAGRGVRQHGMTSSATRLKSVRRPEDPLLEVLLRPLPPPIRPLLDGDDGATGQQRPDESTATEAQNIPV
jgi:hypothetical protein